MACMGERLGAAEMIWEYSGIALRGTEGLELVLARRWDERVSHYEGSETGGGIRNVRKGETRKTL